MEYRLMTVRDVAVYMRLAVKTIRRYVLKREIPFYRTGKIIRFRPEEIEKWVDGGKGKQKAGPEGKQ